MSKADIARAKAGNPHRNPSQCTTTGARRYVCANCHEPLYTTFMKDAKGFYYHKDCPMIMKPMPITTPEEVKHASI